MLRRLLLLLAPLALASCHAAAPVRDADPALWMVKDADTTIYLFGTIHQLRPGLDWFDEAVKDAFDRSDSLELETVLPPEAELRALVRELGAGSEPLPVQLRPELAIKLRDALIWLKQPPDLLDGSKPWFAAIQLGNMPMQSAGYDPVDGAEAVLTREAKREGKPIAGLETARDSFGAFDHLSAKAQQDLLSQAIDGLPKADTLIDSIVAAWSKGDVDAIGKLMNDDLTRSPELEQALLVQRNQHWADWIAARMKAPGTVFVAVGAGHLAGRHALQGELVRRGFRVMRVRY